MVMDCLETYLPRQKTIYPFKGTHPFKSLMSFTQALKSLPIATEIFFFKTIARGDTRSPGW